MKCPQPPAAYIAETRRRTSRGARRSTARRDLERPATPRGPRRRGLQRPIAPRGGHHVVVSRERGSATLWCVALSVVLFTVAMAFALVGVVRVAHHRAQSAADLSALAAARWALASPEKACAQASRLAVQNGAELVRCALTEATADVTVSVGLSLPGVGERIVQARARAGPAIATPGLPTSSSP